MSQTINLPAPFGGQNTKTPTAALQSPFAEKLFNFNTTEVGSSLRQGDSNWAVKSVNTAGGVSSELFNGFVPFGRSSLFMSVDCNGGVGNRYYDISVSGAAPTLAYTSTTMISDGGQVFSTYFNKRVFTFSTVDTGGDYFDGTTWGVRGYTMPAGHNPIGGCAFKNRQYFIFRGTSSYGYSEVSAVAGAVTLVPLGGVIAEESNLAIITPISVSNETASVKLLAFVFFSGEVLFYNGTYPDSPSWELVATANLAEPLNYNAVISPYRGDSLIATRSGLVSLRDLFLQGSEDAEAKLLSDSITPDWAELIEAIESGGFASDGIFIGASIAWWKKKNRIIVSFAFYVNNGTLSYGNTFFVLDTLRGGWAVHRSFGVSSLGISSIVAFKNNLLFCSSKQATGAFTVTISQKEGATDFQDVSTNGVAKVNYDYETLSAPVPFPKDAVYSICGVEPILESDLYAETNYNLVADFGRQTTDNQKTTAPTTAVQKPMVNVGIESNFVQLKISGTTAASKTVGLDLYSFNIMFVPGESGSR